MKTTKTTLCSNCIYGLIREWDCGDEKCSDRHFYKNKCLLGNDYVEIITSCNHHKKAKRARVTYHDPDFDKYEKAIEKGFKEICIKCGKPTQFRGYKGVGACECPVKKGEENELVQKGEVIGTTT